MRRIALFVAVNLLVVLAISLLMGLLGVQPYLSARGLDHRALLVFCALWGFGGAFLSLQLSRWMAKTSMGVVLIDPERPGSPAAARLVELTASVAARSGLETLPEIGVYRSPEVNAFATGPSRRRSLLAVSTGLLESLDDRAVEGVIGHELAHIVNGDMVTMTLLQGVVNAFVMFFARVAAFALDQFLRGRDEEGGGLGFWGHYAAVMLLESVLMLLAAPVIYWFSRLREYRADAGSARTTGTETMIHALASLQRGSRPLDPRAPALSAFKIDGRGRGLAAALFSSHPPIEARIAALRRLRTA